MKKVPIPVLSYDNIRIYARKFLSRYNSSQAIPVPIEAIIEFKFGIDIIPLPGLLQVLEIDGFTSSNLKEISVDGWIYKNRPTRYRFTLAHEIGHVILHREIYTKYQFSSIDTYVNFIEIFPEEDLRWLEWQAYAFAGLVLVPPERLASMTKSAITNIKKKVSLEKSWVLVWDYVSEDLARKFVVSPEVISRRLDYDKIKEGYKQRP